MGQVLHKCAKTTHAVRKEIQESSESLIKISERFGINPKTVAKWRKRKNVGVEDLSMGRKESQSILTAKEELIICQFRKSTEMPLDDCYIALKETIPNLTRSNLYRCFKRYGINKISKEDTPKKEKNKFDNYKIGFVHVDITEFKVDAKKIQLFVAIERQTKFVYVEVQENATIKTAEEFLKNLIKYYPFKIHTILTDNGAQFTHYSKETKKEHPFNSICRENDIKHRLTKPFTPQTNGLVERFNRTIKEHTIMRYFYEEINQLKEHLAQFVLAYNYAKKLKSLNYMTPYEKLVIIYSQTPEYFKNDPCHHLMKPNRALLTRWLLWMYSAERS